MTVGDRRYLGTEPVARHACHSLGRATGQALSGTLASAYAWTQQGARLLGVASGRHGAGLRLVQRPLADLTWSDGSATYPLYAARVSIPPYATHLRAAYAYGVGADVDLLHRLTLVTTAGTDSVEVTGGTTTVELPGSGAWAQDYLSVRTGALELAAATAYGVDAGIVTLELEAPVRVAVCRLSCVVLCEVRP